MRTSRISLVAATATALTALGGGGVALAATTSHPTSLTLKAARASVAPKQKDALTGTLKSGSKALSGQVVKLERRAVGAKAFTVVSTKTTNSKGQVVYTVTPGTKKGQKEQYELVFTKSGSYAGSHSAVITVVVS